LIFGPEVVIFAEDRVVSHTMQADEKKKTRLSDIMIENGMTKYTSKEVLPENQQRFKSEPPNPGRNLSGISSNSITSMTTAAITMRAGKNQPINV